MEEAEIGRIEARSKLDEKAIEFFHRSYWTPAMAACAFAGVDPVDDGYDIPTICMSFGDPEKLAPAAHEADARKILMAYLDHCIEDYDESSPEEIEAVIDRAKSEKLIPFNFLQWFHSNYDGEQATFRPAWAPYWISLAEWNVDSNGAPTPAPPQLVAFAAKLVPLAKSALLLTSKNSDSSLPRLTERVSRVAAILEDKTHALSPVIAQAVRETGEPIRNKEVWDKLITIIEGKSRSVFYKVERGAIKQVKNNIWVPYELGAFNKQLNRAKKKFNAERKGAEPPDKHGQT